MAEHTLFRHPVLAIIVIPAEAGIHGVVATEALDPGFRRDDERRPG